MMHFRNDAEVVHHTCNRTRMRVPDRRGDSLYFDAACRLISELSGVTSATANRHSASIIIRHNTEFQMECITAALHAAALAAPLEGETDIAELGGEYFPQSTERVARRTGNLAFMILQLAVALLCGAALTHVLELLAKNLMQAALRAVAAEVESGSAA
jgi:hypothetical protein